MDSECQELYDNADKLNELLSLVTSWLGKKELQCLNIFARYIQTKCKISNTLKSASQFDLKHENEKANDETTTDNNDDNEDLRKSTLSMLTIPKEYQITYEDFKTGMVASFVSKCANYV
jgi:hypothetical protein